MSEESPKRRKISRKATIGLATAVALIVGGGAIAAPAMAHNAKGPSHISPANYGASTSHGFGYGFGAPSKSAKTVAVNGLVDGKDGTPLTGVTVLIFNENKQGSAAVAATVTTAAVTPTPSASASTSTSASASPSASTTPNAYWPWGLPPSWTPTWTYKPHQAATYNYTVTLPRGTYLFVFLPASDSGLTPSYRTVNVGTGLFGKTSSVPLVKLSATAPATPSPSASASS